MSLPLRVQGAANPDCLSNVTRNSLQAAPVVGFAVRAAGRPAGYTLNLLHPPLPRGKKAALRADRYWLQATARAPFVAEGREGQIASPTTTPRRPSACTCGAIHGHGAASIEHQTAFYGGLDRLRDLGGCPVCAAKVCRRRRRAELAKLDRVGVLSGDRPNHHNTTTPHLGHQKLKELRREQAEAVLLVYSMARAARRCGSGLALRGWLGRSGNH